MMLPVPNLNASSMIASGVILLVWFAFLWSAYRKYDGPMFDRIYYRWLEFRVNFSQGAEKGMEKRRKAIEQAKSAVTGGSDE